MRTKNKLLWVLLIAMLMALTLVTSCTSDTPDVYEPYTPVAEEPTPPPPTPEPPPPTPEPTPIPEPEISFTIISPYATVDWEAWNQYKAAFHVHTRNSDGSASLPQMVERHYELGFNILAITDHRGLTAHWTLVPEVMDNNATNNDHPERGIPMCPDRMADMAAGVGRDGAPGMIGLCNTTEQGGSGGGMSAPFHINTFWVPETMCSTYRARAVLDRVMYHNGVARLNHPGRYTHGRHEDWDVPSEASNNLSNIIFMTNLFLEYPIENFVGMEIINSRDNESRSDRVLWDNILMRTMPERPVWGFSDDDSHSLGAIGLAYNIMLMPELTQDAVRDSKVTGAFYAVSSFARREGVNADIDVSPGNAVLIYLRNRPNPRISNIEVYNGSITITGTLYEVIEWIADGEIIYTGNTLIIRNHVDYINNYVRAQLRSTAGIAFTQPFGIVWECEDN